VTTVYSLDDQIDEVERELRMRARVYSQRMALGVMKPADAAHHMQRMEAVLRTLQALRDQREPQLFGVAT